MNILNIQKIAVVGAGTMGAGIAQVFAQAGYPTLLFDNFPNAIENAKKLHKNTFDKLVEKGKLNLAQSEEVLSNITYSTEINDVVADFVIEAIIEKISIKQELFAKLEAQNSALSILASNTSSLSITEIAQSLEHKNRFLGVHFFNPAPLMKLVEIISGEETSQEVILTSSELITKVGKQKVVCNDSPGFIVNRVARPFYTEALLIAEEKVAELSAIDDLVESVGFKLGPFRLMDLIGNDINYAVTTSLFNAFHYPSRFRPSQLQGKKVLAKHLGKKTGKGFYQY